MRGIWHSLIALAAWLLFFVWWREVLGFTRSQDLLIVIIFIATTVAAATLLNLIWVRHNIAIFRRKGPRTRVTEVSQDRSSDSLGRPIRISASGSILRSRLVTVSVNGKEKIVEPGEAS